MNNHNDFGLKKVDLNKRKLKKKNNFFIPLFLVISVLTIVLLNNYQDLSFNKNIDNKSSKEFISSESPVVIDIVKTDSLNLRKEAGSSYPQYQLNNLPLNQLY